MLEYKTDVHVNAANSGLTGGGGICGQIFAAAGHDKMTAACKAIIDSRVKEGKSGSLAPGEAVYTKSFNLKTCKAVIHTVAPSIPTGRTETADEEKALAQCYINCLNILEDLNYKRIVFPSLGTGLFSYNIERGVEVAVKAIRQWLHNKFFTSVEEIVLSIFIARSPSPNGTPPATLNLKYLNAFELQMQRYFPKVREPEHPWYSFHNITENIVFVSLQIKSRTKKCIVPDPASSVRLQKSKKTMKLVQWIVAHYLYHLLPSLIDIYRTKVSRTQKLGLVIREYFARLSDQYWDKQAQKHIYYSDFQRELYAEKALGNGFDGQALLTRPILVSLKSPELQWSDKFRPTITWHRVVGDPRFCVIPKADIVIHPTAHDGDNYVRTYFCKKKDSLIEVGRDESFNQNNVGTPEKNEYSNAVSVALITSYGPNEFTIETVKNILADLIAVNYDRWGSLSVFVVNEDPVKYTMNGDELDRKCTQRWELAQNRVNYKFTID